MSRGARAVSGLPARSSRGVTERRADLERDFERGVIDLLGAGERDCEGV